MSALPASFIIGSGTSTYGGYTGHTGGGSAMRDGVINTGTSVWGGSSGGAGTKFIADLGQPALLTSMLVKPIAAAFDSWGYSYLTGAGVSYSLDNSSYTSHGTISASDDSGQNYSIAVLARYIMLSASGYLGVGDWTFAGDYAVANNALFFFMDG